jgi:hypothetical protein
MSIKYKNPVVAYHVTHMDHSERAYKAVEFVNLIQEDNFLMQMQCFSRILTYRGVGEEPVFLDQDPCLVVQSIIKEKPYDNGEELSAYFEALKDQNFYCQDKVMLTYQNTIEPITPTWVIFDRNMNLLYPYKESAQQAALLFSNSEILTQQINSFQSGQVFVLN